MIAEAYYVVQVMRTGFVLTTDADLVHRESRLPLGGETPYFKLAHAKRAIPLPLKNGVIHAILGVDIKGSPMEMWVSSAAQESDVSLRLKNHSGCYGRWPIRRYRKS